MKADEKKKKYIKIICGVLAFCLLTGALVYASQRNKNRNAVNLSTPLESEDFAMDTMVKLTVYNSPDGKTVDDGGFSSQILASIHKLEKSISVTDKKSEVYSLNNISREKSVVFEAADIIRKALPFCEATGGLFDISCGTLTSLWDVTAENPVIPDKKEIKAALKKTGYKNIELNGDMVTLSGDVMLDFGAIGKGEACDRALKIFKKSKHSGVLSVGGSILTYGERPDGEKWSVGVKDPLDKTKSACVLKLSGTNNISTSGAYERYFEKDGETYHHIISTKTGYPAKSDILSVTVVCDSGFKADALCTSCFLVGSQKSPELLKKFNAQAVIITKDNKITVTDGLAGKVTDVGENYTFK